MTLQTGRAIGHGIRRALTPTGYLLMALAFIYSLVFLGALNTIIANAMPPSIPTGQIGLTFPIPPSIAGILAGLSLVFGMILYIAATRGLTKDPTEPTQIINGIFTRRIANAVISAIGANIIVSIAVTIGFILLLIPGLFLAISFMFVIFAIGVEDHRAIDALRRSWSLASGNRWRLLAIMLIVGIGTGALSSIGSVLATAINPTLSQIVSLAIAAILSILGYGIFADAYLQLRDTTTPNTPTDDTT